MEKIRLRRCDLCEFIAANIKSYTLVFANFGVSATLSEVEVLEDK